MKSKLNTVRLDAWDLRILAELQTDGRISKSELA
ncbi:MAG: AsnC family transcriptional regulator, partial [Mesorhizobium sp.]